MADDWRLLPSTGALRAFVAAARHLSFSKAATELNLTQGAISRHVRALEEQLSQPLFIRQSGGVVLTDAGQAYLPEISDALERIAAATLGLLAFGGAGGAVDVAVLPTFGHRWLIPRLPEFTRQHGDITINLITHSRPFHLEHLQQAGEGPAVVIDFGDGNWPGMLSTRLMGETVAPVCSPAVLASIPEGAGPDAIARHNLLHLPTRSSAWRDWFDAVGRPDLIPAGGQSFEQFTLVAQAAIAGLGVAIVPLFLFRDELASGRLVRLPGPEVHSRRSYYALWSARRPLAPKARSFVAWLSTAATAFEESADTAHAS